MTRMRWGLLNNPDFRKLWLAETISLFGSQITVLALPLTAVLTLQATPMQMGYLRTAEFLPFLLFTLMAGVWVDRRTKRPLLIFSNVGRALLLLLVPLLALGGLLRMECLYAISFLVGALTVLFQLAYQAYLPSLVAPNELMEGNSKLLASASMADVGGPGLAGLIIGWLTAPLAILLDACSFLVAAASLGMIRRREPEPARVQRGEGLWMQIGQGFRLVFVNPLLRAIVAQAAMYNLFNMVIWALLVLYAVKELRIGEVALGFIMAAGSIGSLVGSLLAKRMAERVGVGAALVGGMTVGCAAPLILLMAEGGTPLAPVILTVYLFVAGCGVAMSNVHVISLRQSVTPAHLFGRMNASYRFIVTGTIPIGSFLGGYLGDLFGMKTALIIGAAGLLLAPLWVVFSPVPGLKSLPVEAPAGR
ncbi:MFS transporter [Brevibacillus sp. SYP-B805]|uniref:MFS transporter n=1 Tax=Brevibacillus sp. SYP-B805 TaxID=1578199 RepID=UPI0013EBAE13|nr:MFS transporter [Brevibacillus sp. SYP-B805]NGQ96878.1 MFS transporter [Brevibacillus sp. SYP-B805]